MAGFTVVMPKADTGSWGCRDAFGHLCVCPSQVLPGPLGSTHRAKAPAHRGTLQNFNSDKFKEPQPRGEETCEEKCKMWIRLEEIRREIGLCKEVLHAQGHSPKGTMAMVGDLC